MTLSPNSGEMSLLKKFVRGALLQKKTIIPGSRVLKQGYGKLHSSQSVSGGAINIGGKTYQHGLGTHAVSEILISLPENTQLFTAETGFDFNDFTKQRSRGRLVFAVKSKDKVLWKSSPLAISDKPAKVRVPLKGLREIILEVGDDSTGIDGAHANWADAMITLKNGSTQWVEELISGMDFPDLLPFSFNLNGISSQKFLPEWPVKSKSNHQKDRVLHQISYRKPGENFEVRCEITEFLNHAAVEWRMHFKNTGNGKSPAITQILPLDIRIKEPATEAKLHYNRGSACNLYDFQPLTELLLDNRPFSFNCRHAEIALGGRSSERYLPFWNLDCSGEGVVCGLGWSGSWKAEFDYEFTAGQVKMRAGMDGADLYLKPGEEISSPSICLLFWNRAEVIDSHNLFRRFMGDVCVPKWENKEPLTLAVAGNIYGLEKVSEENQIEVIRKVSGCGANTYWIDAGWYQTLTDGGAWDTCRGNWFADKKKFPKGLKPVADQAHKHGFKFLLWFDPESVCPGTAIAKEHPEWIIWKNKNETGLFNLGIPEARKYLTGLISSRIEEFGVDVYRNDFNLWPGPFWEVADEPGRKGITEIRYVEGLYQFWDELRKKHPRLLIDNCASGGRRIDYETCKRSVPLTRSDMQCSPKHPLFAIFSQNQTYGLSLYLPVHSVFTENLETYNVRSVATGSILLGVPQRVPDKPFRIPLKELKERFAELKKYHHLFLADFYPLTEFSLGEDAWMAYQFYSPEKGEGFALFFRRDKAPYTEADFQLKALEPKSRYTLTFVDTGKKRTDTGKKIEIVKIKLKKRSSALILIKKVK